MKPFQIALGIILGIALTSATIAVVHRHGSAESEAGHRAIEKPPSQPEISELKRQNDRLRAELEVARQRSAALSPRSDAPGRSGTDGDFQVFPASPGSPSKGEEAESRARNLYDLWADATKGGRPDPELERKLLAAFSELKPELASHFIKRYQRAEGVEERGLAMNLALACGGMDTTRWITSLLNDPGTPPDERARLLGGLVSGGRNPFSSISPSEELTQAALTLVRTQNSIERAAGAALLGTTDAPQSLLELRRLLESEAEAKVRVEAIRSLGRVGDSAVLEYFKQIATVPEFASTPEVKLALEKAIRSLDRRMNR